MPSCSNVGAIAKARVPIAPVANFTQLVDWGYNVNYSQLAPQSVGEYWTDQITPRSGAQFSPAVVAGSAQLDPYPQALTAKRPIYELNGGFNGFPCGRGDGGSWFITSSTANMAGTFNGVNTPFIYYVSAQWLVQTNQALFSFGNSGTNNGFFEQYAATTGNKMHFAKEDTTGAPGLKDLASATNDALRYVWRAQFDGTNLTIERDGVVVLAATAFTTGNPSCNQDAFFALVRTTATVFGHGRFNRRLYYAKSSETAGEKLQNYKFMHQGYLRAPSNASFLITEGDSTSELQNPWWMQLATQGLGGVWVANPSIGSETLATMLTRQLDHVNSNYAQGYARDVVTIWACSNDLLAGTLATTCQTNLASFTTSSKAANPSRGVIGATVPAAATITGANETQRLALNTFIRANGGPGGSLGFDDFVDRDIILGGTAFPTSGLTIDGTHCNDAGNLLLVTGANSSQGIKDKLVARGY